MNLTEREQQQNQQKAANLKRLEQLEQENCQLKTAIDGMQKQTESDEAELISKFKQISQLETDLIKLKLKYKKTIMVIVLLIVIIMIIIVKG